MGEEGGLGFRYLAYLSDGGAKDVVHSAHVKELCFHCHVDNEDEFHRPFGGCELVGFPF